MTGYPNGSDFHADRDVALLTNGDAIAKDSAFDSCSHLVGCFSVCAGQKCNKFTSTVPAQDVRVSQVAGYMKGNLSHNLVGETMIFSNRFFQATDFDKN